MISTRFASTLLALALLAPALACNSDEEALVTPRNGVWQYMEREEVSNTCNDDNQIDPPTEFVIDYDEGDSFDIERGAEDIRCEIDGYDFTCNRLFVGEVDLNPAIEAVLSYYVSYAGSFDSETEAEGTETVDVECEGSACATTLAEIVPCRTVVRFDTNYLAG